MSSVLTWPNAQKQQINQLPAAGCCRVLVLLVSLFTDNPRGLCTRIVVPATFWGSIYCMELETQKQEGLNILNERSGSTRMISMTWRHVEAKRRTIARVSTFWLKNIRNTVLGLVMALLDYDISLRKKTKNGVSSSHIWHICVKWDKRNDWAKSKTDIRYHLPPFWILYIHHLIVRPPTSFFQASRLASSPLI